MNKTRVAAIIAGLALGAAWLGQKQEGTAPTATWPTRTVRVIVLTSTGGAIDLTARLLAERLANVWQQSVVVDNRPGGEGFVGTAAFANARDDHTLLFSGTSVITLYPQTRTKLPYDAEHDLVPITAATEPTIVISVTATLPAKSVAELVALVRQHPGRYIWTAIPGLPELVFSGIVQQEKLEMKHASYSEISMALQDLAQGRVHVNVAAMSAIHPHVRAGRVHLLAVATTKRSVAAPHIPTLAEAGYPQFTMDSSFGFYGWRGMPDDLRDRIAADVENVLSEPVLAARLTAMGQNPRASPSAEFAAMHERQSRQISALLQAVGSKRK